MNYRLPNEKKMRNYLDQFSYRKVTEKEWEDCIENFVGFAEYIEEEMEGKQLIQEGASTEVDIGKDSYEVWIIFNWVYEHGVKIVLIDFDYSYSLGIVNGEY